MESPTGMTSPSSKPLTLPSFPSTDEEQVRGPEQIVLEADGPLEMGLGLVRDYVWSVKNTLAEIGRRIDSIDTELAPFRAEWNDRVDQKGSLHII